MKSTILVYMTACTVSAALGAPSRLAAQDQQDHDKNQTHYSLTTLATLGGTYGTAQQMNSRGMISGDANLSGDTTEHATFWRDGAITDLGTLGGFNSAASEVNDRGLILGVSQTATIDPFGENWGLLLDCSASGGPCQGYQNLVIAVTWRSGVITALPTLGGNNAQVGFTTGLNNKGEAVGWAENRTQDPNCIPPQVFDFEAVIWGPKKGEIHELPPLPGDTIGAAFGINDKSQVVGGTSGSCAFPSFSLPLHPVLWHNGAATNLGTLGGMMNNAALSINNQGQIVGISDLPGDTATHAVLWQNGNITDLGTLQGDFLSFAYGINNKGQVVVQSCDVNFNCRAAIWQNGVMTDLNTLTPTGSLYLMVAYHINDRGEITGQGFDQNTGGTPAFLAVPTVDASEGALPGTQVRDKVILPENVRKRLQQQRGFGRFGAGLTRPQ